MTGPAAFVGFLATIPAANWLIGNVGTFCVPDGPCLIPVGFGLTAPSGVLMIGLALVLRDFVHRELGWRWALAAIFIGAALAWFVAPPALVVASVTCLILSELADQGIYARLREQGLVLAVIASGIVGAVVDSVLFLWLAFGSLDYLAGQVVGKLMMVGLAALAIAVINRRAAA